MGLDSVELVVKIERTFDIQIPDKVAEITDTVGKMYDVVWDRVKNNANEKCVSQKLFYQLRALIVQETGVTCTIAPSTPLVGVLPRRGRRQIWGSISKRSGLRLPRLVLPKIINYLTSCILVTILCVGIVYTYVAGLWYLVLAIAAMIGTGSVLFFAFTPLRSVFPVATMQQLTESVMMLNYAMFSGAGISRKDVETIINNVISEQIGVPLHEVSAEKHFVRDLGIDAPGLL